MDGSGSMGRCARQHGRLAQPGDLRSLERLLACAGAFFSGETCRGDLRSLERLLACCLNLNV